MVFYHSVMLVLYLGSVLWRYHFAPCGGLGWYVLICFFACLCFVHVLHLFLCVHVIFVFLNIKNIYIYIYNKTSKYSDFFNRGEGWVRANRGLILLKAPWSKSMTATFSGYSKTLGTKYWVQYLAPYLLGRFRHKIQTRIILIKRFSWIKLPLKNNKIRIDFAKIEILDWVPVSKNTKHLDNSIGYTSGVNGYELAFISSSESTLQK